MKKSLNNKGFTLVELLAVLVILVAIMAIAIPSISSSLERSKGSQDDARIRVLESAGELYITDHKNKIYEGNFTDNKCMITLQTLKNDGYITDEELKDSDGKEFTGRVIFDKSDGSVKYDDNGTYNECGSK